jgi:hypothetical protein
MRRSLAVWFVMLLAASGNGAIREGWLIPNLGDAIGRAISTLILCSLVLLLTWSTIRWISPRSTREAWMIGAFWVALTLAFEFLGGRYLFGKSWGELAQDYNLLRGRIWVVALVTIAIAPRVCASARGVIASAAEKQRSKRALPSISATTANRSKR